ncbi:lysylphosphatidylglycerol synthase transmembrane domain-containing protein [Isoptericola sp. b441]|uniref:Lysylphosphatidylglycerol synthase transmembrane domain-containing protein n=1 Tax=Actinotalea lenta TaxID=3064654 RepID=A0ABT9DB89_9CELL|nr:MULTISPECIES: lysylphosphatidylglycerol synthase transmembrane domain-containing protein [unclassified Isoptericola]MDO8106212.1 lysylphosphatidylglycerol synthase transmembrane domain-containing protein [Isoptericola sp. b441]MDO8122068.1 lysylphosphatidylglycerol synthase transmembrane domain-containing protein [Isoptericola sp. b490]
MSGPWRTGPPGPSGPVVRIVDTPTARVHHPGDLVALILSAVGIAAVCILAVYAQGTTTGVTEDVQGFASVVRRLVFFPVTVLEALITIVAPIAALGELLLRRLLRHAAEAVLAAALGLVASQVATWLITHFGIPALQQSFSVYRGGQGTVTLPGTLIAVTALLTVAGPRSRRRTVAWSWNAVWVGLGAAMVTGLLTLPGALTTALLGRMVGTAIRFASGVQSERAYGRVLVDGVRRAGTDPAALYRVHSVPDDHGHGDAALAGDPASVALARHSDQRVYAMVDRDGARRDVLALDGDRQVVGVLMRWWRSLRLRGIDGRAVVSLRQVAERVALLSYAAASAGVHTPRLLSMAEADDSMLLVFEHVPGAVPLGELDPAQLDDATLDAIWSQLRVAHQAGLAHRALTADAVLVTDRAYGHRVLLTGWESGDVASSELARRVDIAQLLGLLALQVGAARAVDSAGRVLTPEELATIGPLLQTIVMPRATREAARSQRGLMAEVREALLERMPEADVEPERLARFGVRTVLTLALTIAAGVLVVTTINIDQIRLALTESQPWWAAATFGLGMLTFLGGAIALVAFSPVRLPLWRATLVQCAASFVALVAPAGVGPAALNLRMLTRRGVSNGLAVASVGLVQISQLLTTIVVLLGLSLVSGSSRALHLPSSTMLAAIAVVLVAVGAALLVPRVRRWVIGRTVPIWRQTWPRLVRMLSQPKRFAVAVGGNLIVTLSYLGAFWASLAAFGQELSLIDLALIYLVGNAAGAVIPTPGGLGTVEVALFTGLTATGGIPAGIATSAVALFRGLTFWGRVPFGWLSMRALQRTGEL